jgi:hypothetical protein
VTNYYDVFAKKEETQCDEVRSESVSQCHARRTPIDGRVGRIICLGCESFEGAEA